ncbi:MAG: hypothetical protein QM734_03130 [Cyclobacteriaceae bacterium]
MLSTSATTSQLNCISSYRDLTSNSFVASRTVTNTNNVTDVNIIPAPTGNTQRVADYISVYNGDAASAAITINYNANGTKYKLWKGTLAVGEKLEYTDEKGFKIMNSIGAMKQSINQGTNADSGVLNSVVLSNDVANSNAVANTMADITGLSFPMLANSTYTFKFVIPYTSPITTTGSRWSINSGAAFSQLNYSSTYTLTAIAQTINYANTYDTPSASNNTSLLDGNVAVIEGTIATITSGTLIGRFASKVANSAITAKAGAVLYYQKIA